MNEITKLKFFVFAIGVLGLAVNGVYLAAVPMVIFSLLYPDSYRIGDVMIAVVCIAFLTEKYIDHMVNTNHALVEKIDNMFKDMDKNGK